MLTTKVSRVPPRLTYVNINRWDGTGHLVRFASCCRDRAREQGGDKIYLGTVILERPPAKETHQ